jgi:leader peptidase (prepilin peptidase)/N-methyltransferase
MLEQLIGLFIFLFGLCWGSFLNVCIYRLPQDKSVVAPRSFCPSCKNTIRWFDNIPVLSYVLLGAKCRVCKCRISLRYPMVEMLVGLLFLLAFHKFGVSPDLFKFAFFFAMLVLVSAVDIDYHAIPVYFCFLGILVGMGFAVYETVKMLHHDVSSLESFPIVGAFKGLIFGFGLSYLFKFFGDILLDFYLRFKKRESIEGETESLGLGDVDFLGMVGVFLGVKGAVLTFFLAPFVAVIYAIYAFTFKKSHLIPYLPYLSIGCMIAFLWGDKILSFIF